VFSLTERDAELSIPRVDGMSEVDTHSGRNLVVGVVGPTAAGKSSLAISLAKSFDGEVISCDALQVYRKLDIGTGKLRDEEQKQIPHHLMDRVNPDQEYCAADYLREVVPLVEDLNRLGKLPLVVGGTGLYLRALRKGLFEGPGRTPELRSRIDQIARRRGSPFVHRMLARLDASAAERIHPNDLMRSVRALEVIFQTRTAMSEMMLRRRSLLESFRFVIVGLAPPRKALAERIERRVAEMFEEGFVTEVESLLKEYGSTVPAFKAIGYREIASYLSGEISVEQARALIVKATTKYAKRQMTWFRREEGVVWFEGWGDDPETDRAVREHVDVEINKKCSIGEETLYAETAS
jgi:tRNA dimethylallyltransferase